MSQVGMIKKSQQETIKYILIGIHIQHPKYAALHIQLRSSTGSIFAATIGSTGTTRACTHATFSVASASVMGIVSAMNIVACEIVAMNKSYNHFAYKTLFELYRKSKLPDGNRCLVACGNKYKRSSIIILINNNKCYFSCTYTPPLFLCVWLRKMSSMLFNLRENIHQHTTTNIISSYT
jgi:hypothetical protein